MNTNKSESEKNKEKQISALMEGLTPEQKIEVRKQFNNFESFSALDVWPLSTFCAMLRKKNKK